jgi:serine/threonine protein kinase
VRKAKAQPDNTVNAILRAGQLVDGKYRVERLIGQGGMAAVWAGTNERTGKRVALKVILRSLATTREAQELFHSEVLAASRVNHPNVVTVFDVIEHEGMPCIVMELLDGEPLGNFIAFRGFLTVSEATMVLLPAMRGVAAAHAQGVIHRDLKPQNIFICIGPDGRVVTTKVLDFGISVMMERMMDQSAGPDPALAMGTPAYMSPEHLKGSARIDERSDVYGFGVLLYEALTGQIPFPGEPGPELFNRILNEPPPPLAALRPDLPAGLVGIVEKAMAKAPGDRYSNLNLLLGSIEDELAPATPAPRVLTPIAGVPESVLRERSSGNSVVQAAVEPEPTGPFPETQLFISPPAENDKPPLGAGEPDSAPPAPVPEIPSSVVQAVLEQEPSGQFQETQLFIARPTEKDIPVVATDGQADDGSSNGQSADGLVGGQAAGGFNDGLQAVALPLPMEPEASSSFQKTSQITVPLSGLRSLAIFQDRRVVVGAGCAIVLGFAVWMGVRSTGDDRKAARAPIANPAPAASKPPPPPTLPAPEAANPAVAVPAPAVASPAVEVPAPAAATPAVEVPAPAAATPAVEVPAPAATNPAVEVPAPAATNPAVEVPAPLAASPSPDNPSSPATTEHREATRPVRDAPVSAASRRSYVAAKNTAPLGRHAAHSARNGHASALNLSPAATAGSSTRTAAPAPVASPSPKSAPPRAGSLSADDF